jgi:hypothetical protein
MLSVVMLNVIMLSVIMMSVIMLNIVAPFLSSVDKIPFGQMAFNQKTWHPHLDVKQLTNWPAAQIIY